MKILIIKLSSIGDLVHTIPSYHALKKNLKDLGIEAQIDWLVYENLAPSLYRSIEKENLVTIKNRKLSQVIKKALDLKQQYDYVIDLQGLFKTALISKIIAPNSNYGFRKPREEWARYFYKDSFCNYKSISSKKHVLDQNLELIASFFKSVFKKEFQTSVEFGLNHSLKSNTQKNLCIIPCTSWESKHWSKKKWQSLIENFQSNDLNLYMTGAKSDLDKLKEIASSSKKKIEIVTDKKLEELYDFYSTMDYVIGVDTGPLHIAAASLYKDRATKKVVGIYGPSSGSRSGPYGFDAISADELLRLKASNKKTYAKDGETINQISVENILKHLDLEAFKQTQV